MFCCSRLLVNTDLPISYSKLKTKATLGGPLLRLVNKNNVELLRTIYLFTSSNKDLFWLERGFIFPQKYLLGISITLLVVVVHRGSGRWPYWILSVTNLSFSCVLCCPSLVLSY